MRNVGMCLAFIFVILHVAACRVVSIRAAFFFACAGFVLLHAPKQTSADWMGTFIWNWNKPDLCRVFVCFSSTRGRFFFLPFPILEWHACVDLNGCESRTDIICADAVFSVNIFSVEPFWAIEWMKPRRKLLSQQQNNALASTRSAFFCLAPSLLLLLLPLLLWLNSPMDFVEIVFWAKHHDIVINGFGSTVVRQAYAGDTNRKIMYLRTNEPFPSNEPTNLKHFRIMRYYFDFRSVPVAGCRVSLSLSLSFRFQFWWSKKECMRSVHTHTYTCVSQRTAHTIAFNFVDAWNEIISNVQLAEVTATVVVTARVCVRHVFSLFFTLYITLHTSHVGRKSRFLSVWKGKLS